MKDLLKKFVGKTLRIYTVSGVESYLDILEEVKTDYIVLKGYFKGDRTYLAIDCIESFKEEPKRD
ncbi:MAG TPA: hypothetical protein VMT12_04805 [Syntrophales bacterium]|nr:hypothetical protein [Syntrophales bacterium]